MESRLITRRRLLAAAGLLGGLAATDAFGVEPRAIEISHHDVPIPRLPAGLDGLRIAQVTDVHLYNGMHASARRAMAQISQLRPDVTVLTGDLCENRAMLPEITELVAGCRGRLATIGVMGNWERQVGVTPSDAAAAFERAGAAFLNNESLTVERGGARLLVVGLDDPLTGVPLPEQALASADTSLASIWLFHTPGFADLATVPAGVTPGLWLSGHTHGGQIRLPPIPAIVPPGSGRFVAGWYRDTAVPFYVSRGIGSVVIRARFLCRPELPVFTLRRVEA